MASALRQLAVHGNLSALVGMIDNPDRRLADEEGFRRARAEFAALAEQMSWLRNGGLTKPAVVRAAAREAASIVAGVAGTVALLLITRSEEHTSELQSLMRISYAVFCLKKKTTPQT